MGGITFLDYVKELPKGKREAKGATKGGYATKQKAPVAAKTAAPAAAVGSSARALPGGGVEEAKGGGGGGGRGGSGDPEADAIADKIASKVMLEYCTTVLYRVNLAHVCKYISVCGCCHCTDRDIICLYTFTSRMSVG